MACALTAEPRRGVVVELSAAVLLTVGVGAVMVATPGQIPLTYLTMGTAAWVGFRFTPAVGGLYTLVFGTPPSSSRSVAWVPSEPSRTWCCGPTRSRSSSP